MRKGFARFLGGGTAPHAGEIGLDTRAQRSRALAGRELECLPIATLGFGKIAESGEELA